MYSIVVRNGNNVIIILKIHQVIGRVQLDNDVPLGMSIMNTATATDTDKAKHGKLQLSEPLIWMEKLHITHTYLYYYMKIFIFLFYFSY